MKLEIFCIIQFKSTSFQPYIGSKTVIINWRLPTDTILSEYSMNCLKKKKKFKELTSLCYAVTDAALKSNKNLTKMDAIQLIGKVIRHSSDRIKRTSTNMDFNQ
ncbi:uncharacterized protein LOC136095475 [Hydra vulgaris]|uniref:uncharacterized protein LOC136094918 n=1 Tax=Hydra vulgaris TaxID=6087 RepID=UPI0032EA25A2